MEKEKSDKRAAKELVPAVRRARNYNYQLVGTLLVQARQEFVKEIGRDPKIKFCAELKALIPLYQQAVAEYKLSGVRFEHRYEKETYPLELKRALDQCTERNGYSDGWFRGAAAETLHSGASIQHQPKPTTFSFLMVLSLLCKRGCSRLSFFRRPRGVPSTIGRRTANS